MVLRSLKTLAASLVLLCLLAGLAAAAAARKGDDGLDTLKQLVADLKKSPENIELREKVIKHAQGMRQRPPVPEEFERQMARGGAYLKMATDKEGFNKANETFKAAIALAPWVADGYVQLADAQEKAGLFAEAIQNLNFALLADPNAKNARELRNRIYELEVFAEDAKQQLKASPNVPAPTPPAPPVVAKAAPPAAKKAAPAAKKVNPKAFVGSWFYKDTAPRGGESITTHAFSISQNEKGELAAQAPRRTTGAVGSITIFEHDDDNIRLQITWKLATIPTYWKTEDYNVTLSADETKLSGAYKIKSSGSREFAEDKVLFKQ